MGSSMRKLSCLQSKAALTILAALALPIHGNAQSAARIQTAIREYRTAHEATILAELRELLAIPNVASDSTNIRRNADLLVRMLARRGVQARLLETAGSPPAVYGELPAPGATRTIVLYAHYDGQPVDTARWASPAWNPVLRSGALQDGGRDLAFPDSGQRVDPESRIYARSASDDKSPIVAMVAALDALQAQNVERSVNLKFFFEGEEEAGSDHLREMLTRHAGLLRADLWLFMDGPVHQSRRQQIVFGVRGVMGVNLTVYGPLRPLHSGHYGNWAPNPNVLMAHLIASLRDPDGKILIPGFYDDVKPPTAAERAAFAAAPPIDDQLRRELGLARTEAGNALLAERLMLPALNVGGLQGGRTGRGGANLIGTETSAYIDFRLVPDQSPRRVRELFVSHLRNQGWHVVDDVPDSAARRTHPRLVRVVWSDSGYPSNRTPLDLPAARAVLQTAREAMNAPVIAVPILGGSLPLYHFSEALGAPLITVPIVNHDNNQHGENENLRLQNLWDGIELIGGLIARLGRVWELII
jgi:acetylornithine deacetylase/succinyl-diaminopimelate desuccinylase-like protein